MKLLCLLISLLACIYGQANDSSAHIIKINFLYGSKPAKGYKDSESKYFGGLKGGHINIEAGGRVLDFMPGKCPLLPDNKNPSGGFRISRSVYWDTATDKSATIIVPVTAEEYNKFQQLFDSLVLHQPYDYAVFGMRCAAASYDVLSKAGLFKDYPKGKDAAKFFYPKLLRKKLLQWAKKNNYTIVKHAGRPSRKWESDCGLF